jgi:hypothetical protein
MTMIGKHPAMEKKAQTINNNLNILHPRIHGHSCLSQKIKEEEEANDITSYSIESQWRQ